jgi:hypothetical protein
LSDGRFDDVRFSEEQVREILEDALAPESSGSLSATDGVSLAELKTIGEEVGIDPRRVESAARALARRGTTAPATTKTGRGLLGGPAVLSVERTVTGDYTPEADPEILAAIRGSFGTKGDPDQGVFGALEWGSTSETRARYVTVSSRGGETTVRGSVNLTGLRTIMYVPVTVIGGFLSVVGFTQAADAAIAVGMVFFTVLVPTLLLILRMVLNRVSDSEAAKLESVVDEVARIAGTRDD